jgi:hypothetical protein
MRKYLTKSGGILTGRSILNHEHDRAVRAVICLNDHLLMADRYGLCTQMLSIQLADANQILNDIRKELGINRLPKHRPAKQGKRAWWAAASHVTPSRRPASQQSGTLMSQTAGRRGTFEFQSPEVKALYRKHKGRIDQYVAMRRANAH